MSDGGYSSDEFEPSGAVTSKPKPSKPKPSKPPVSAMLLAAGEVAREESSARDSERVSGVGERVGKVGREGEREARPSKGPRGKGRGEGGGSENDGRVGNDGARSGDPAGKPKPSAKRTKGRSGGVPSAEVPPKKLSKEKEKKEKKKRKKEARKRASAARPPSPTFSSKLWPSDSRSSFARPGASAGTRTGSALMHAAYACGEEAERDLERMLKGPKKEKEKGRRRKGGGDESSGSESDLDDDARSVLERTSANSQKSWTQGLGEADDQGWTALHWAASRGNASAVEALTKASKKGSAAGGGEGGAQPVSLVDVPELLFEWTPLFLACIELHVECVAALLSAGASADLADSLGDRPLEACSKLRPGRRKDAIRAMLKKAMDDPDLSSEEEESEEEEEESEEEESEEEEEEEESGSESD